MDGDFGTFRLADGIQCLLELGRPRSEVLYVLPFLMKEHSLYCRAHTGEHFPAGYEIKPYAQAACDDADHSRQQQVFQRNAPDENRQEHYPANEQCA